MKVSKRTNRICLGLAIAGLVAIFFYQVAYATNESSYKFGYSTTVNTAHCLAHPTTDIGGNVDDCDRGYISVGWVCGFANDPDSDHKWDPNHYVTNQTACDDGVINGFTHCCSTDMKGCASIIKQGEEDNITLGATHILFETSR